MTAVHRIAISVLVAVAVSAILTLCGMGHGKPAAIGVFAAVIVRMALKGAANAKA